ncbi:hypothetical protein GGR50DRAFT_379520 [Xylaria sp. CBS 124048]|nr:hypothetical protein GGR50DRAFT_379520 [Xylaria sp. CBS 124048]
MMYDVTALGGRLATFKRAWPLMAHLAITAFINKELLWVFGSAILLNRFLSQFAEPMPLDTTEFLLPNYKKLGSLQNECCLQMFIFSFLFVTAMILCQRLRGSRCAN